MSDFYVSTHTLTLCVAHYWRGRASDGQGLPLHWAHFLISNAIQQSLSASSSGREAAEQTEYEYMEMLAKAYRGCLPLGNIDLDRSAEAERLMQQVVIHRGGEDWNCQSWVLAAVEKLQAKGILPSHVSSDRIRSGLEEVLCKWKS